VLPATAQRLNLIRDTEIEELLKDYSRPIFRAAGLESQNIDMRIVQSDSFNAFVMDGRNVFMHTETLMQSDTPNQVIGIIAHETGHIAGAHPATLRNDLKTAQTNGCCAAARHRPDGRRAMSGRIPGELGGPARVSCWARDGGDSLVLLKRRSQERLRTRRGSSTDNDQATGRGVLETFERLARNNLGTTAIRTCRVASDRGSTHPAAARPGRTEPLLQHSRHG
jgi:predicted Zn-dependent protease